LNDIMDRRDGLETLAAAEPPVERAVGASIPERPSLSIVVAWDGEADRLHGWADEVLRITREWDVEIIAVAARVDPESTAFAAADRRLRLIPARGNEAPPLLRRMGMDAAKGYVVLFLDTQDGRSLNRLRQLIRQLIAMQR
jgi:hypothetical protein